MHDKESAIELSPVTRHSIGGGSGDTDVPPQPLFGVSCLGQGRIEVAGVGFEELVNTSSVTSANLTLHYEDEVAGAPAASLATDVDESSAELTIAEGAGAEGSLLRIGREIVVVRAVDGSTFGVERGACGTTASAHDAGARVVLLLRKTLVLPFPRRFFGSQASGSFAHVVTLPDISIAAAEMSVTNSRGISQATWSAYTNTPEYGLRSLSGGQIALQVDGPLAIQSDAAPPLSLDASHAVRDVYAIVSEAPLGGDASVRVTVDGTAFATLTIPDGQTTSNVLGGLTTGPLLAGARLGLDVIGVGTTYPGAGLSVSVRL